jgi:restriction system protein
MTFPDQTLDGPQFVQFFGPVLAAINELGGSARPAEVRGHLIDRLKLSDDYVDGLLPSGSTTRFANQVAWARFYLVKAGLIDASRRGVWAITERGRHEGLDEHLAAFNLFKSIHSAFPRAETNTEETSKPGATESGALEKVEEVIAEPVEHSYRDEVRKALLDMSPAGFERFCQRLLRESGFQEVRVTGQTGDGGIDGIGILEVNPLVTFKVLFQCKRYEKSVPVGAVRDFRGAMSGRADKGVVITTGVFTASAREESIRDGAAPIELVDGEKLVDMLEALELGVTPVSTFDVDLRFFESFDS